MNKHYNTIKWTVIIISAIMLLLLGIFTIDVINEEPDWAWFNIDFDNPKVSNYATLISGLLSFLAILFVIFNITEQREQLERERKDKKDEVIKDYENRLKLLKSLLLNVTSEIKEQGKRMKAYYKIELEHPTQPNMTHFSANKSFNRMLEMDYSMNYQVFQHFFENDDNWEKTFLNLSSYVDFYSESLVEHRQKYQNHIQDKVKRHREISDMCATFLNLCAEQIEKYRTELGTHKYLENEWVIICNDFIPAYYDYFEECKIERKPTDFRILSDDFFLVFLKNSMILRNKNGFDDYNSEKLVRTASKIRKKIYEVEMYSVQYAENIKYYFDEYFDENSKSYKNFEVILEKVKQRVEQMF